MAFVLRGFGRTLPSLGPASLRSARRQVIGGKQYCSSSNDASGDSENKTKMKTKAEEKRKAAKLKLNDLLESIQKTPAPPSVEDGGVSGRLARPGRQPRPRHVVTQSDRPAPASASTPTPTPAPAPAATQPPPAKQPTLDEEVAQAARDVASSLGGDAARTEAELLFKLSGEDEASADRPQLSELMSGMKVDQRPAPGRSQHVRHQLGERRADAVGRVRRERAETSGQQRAPSGQQRASSERHWTVEHVQLYTGEALGIFTDQGRAGATELAPAGAATQWERLHERELRLAVTHPPTNAWQEMILWTEQGKLWHLPVDNEQGLEAEAAVGFHEHVFLERHLEPWCPQRGPLRHFMELVCVALGKNPWLSIEEKREHIAWFRDYFADKQQLLAELKAV